MKERVLSLVLTLGMLLTLPAMAAERVEEKEGVDYPHRAPSGIFYGVEDDAAIVSDVWNKVLWKYQNGAFLPYVGETGVKGLDGEPVGVYNDSVPEHAFFMEPWAVSPYLDGYAVSDTAANVVRYVTEKMVYTLSGSGREGIQNGRGGSTSFRAPTGLATDGEGNLYVADTGNNAIRKITPKGMVTVWRTELSEPTGLCWHDGWLYVAETGKNRIVRIKSAAQAEVLAGLAIPAEESGTYYGGYADGPVSRAEFDHPQGVAVGEDGTVYVADTLNHAIRAIRDGRVYTLSKTPDQIDMPVSPRGLALRKGVLYAADPFAMGVLELPLAKKAYADVSDGAWFADAVNEATARGLCNGTSPAEFSPEAVMTRAMFVTMLARLHKTADGTAVIDGEPAFSDVPEADWFSAGARWAAAEGIVNGVGEGCFGPSLTISREQIVTMLYRYARAQELEGTAAPETVLSGFADGDSVSDWAQEAMRWAVGKGIVRGSDGLLLPGDPATRAQVATIFIQFMDEYRL